MRFVFRTLLVLTLLFYSALTVSAQNQLAPVDTSSPRATISTFIENMKVVHQAYEDGSEIDTLLYPVENLYRCFDLKDIAPAEREARVRDAVMILADIFGRIELPPLEQIPGLEDIQENPLWVWSVPGTEIEIEWVALDDHHGAYQFNSRTVEKLPEIYQRIRNLPYRENAWVDAYKAYLNIAGKWIPMRLSKKLPSWATLELLGNPRWKILTLALLLCITTGFVLLIRFVRKKLHARFTDYPGKGKMVMLVSTLCLMALLATFRESLVNLIGLRGGLLDWMITLSTLSIYFIGILGVINLFNMAYIIITNSKKLMERGLNTHLIKIIIQIASVIMVVLIAVRAVEYLGFRIAPLLAGLGLGGVAIALAARPTFENIFGGLVLFADKPVKVGDLCKFGENLGFVEEIGLRSTRIRKLDDTQVSIPNAQFSQLELENQSRRKKFLYRTVLQFRYESSPDQMRYLIARLREMLLAHPKAIQDEFQRVRFMSFGEYSLDVEMYVNIRAKTLPNYLAIREDINFRIADLVNEAGMAFAFPSTTAYVAQDAPADEKVKKSAEEAIGTWRNNQELPYPDPSRQRKKELKGTLDFPPEGSVDAEHPDE